MNGLLHRLAARALGTAPAVRSNVTLPWQGESMGEDLPASPELQRAAPRLDLKPTAPDVADEREIPDRTGAVADPTSLPPVQNSIDEPHPGSEVRAQIVHANRDPVPPPLQPRIPKEHDDERTKALEAPAPLVQVLRDTPLPRRESANRESQHPALNVPVASTKPIPHQRAPAPENRARVQPTEVHVHIGRIDVTAVRETQRPRRKAAEPRSAISLDAYLTSRSRP